MRRLVCKTLAYRLYASCLTVLAAFIVTGHVVVSGAIGLVEFAIKGIGYYVFERTWERVQMDRATR